MSLQTTNTAWAAQYGPWALVAGASEGIGRAFAEALSRRGLNLILVARGKEKLERLGRQLAAEAGVNVRTVAADLADSFEIQRVIEASVDIRVGLVVYNAAYSTICPFLQEDVSDHLRVIDVNVSGPTRLVHHFASSMRDRGRGGIVLMTSLSAFQGSALIATYAASKAYLLSLAEALSFELTASNVHVLACCAGATRTPGYLASPPETGRFAPPEMDPEGVVEGALKALGRKPVVIAGFRNRLSHIVLHRMLPRRLAVRIMGSAMMSFYRSATVD